MKVTVEQSARLLAELDAIALRATELEERYAAQLAQVHSKHQRSARNLLHYLALREHDRGELQDALESLGLSRLGNVEGHVLASTGAVRSHLLTLAGGPSREQRVPVSLKRARKLDRKRTNALLGKKLKGAATRIMVTLPSTAAHDRKLVLDLVKAGMNCARINCAHDNREAWAQMIAHVEWARSTTGRACRVFMDLAGPKVRTGRILEGPPVVRIRPRRDRRGKMVAPAEVRLVDGSSTVESGAPAPAFDHLTAQWIPSPRVDLPVNKELLAQLEPNSVLAFRDARDKAAKLRVISTGPDWALATCSTGVYLESGTKLKADKGERRVKGRVGRLAPLPGEIRLSTGDRLLIHGDQRPGEPALRDAGGQVVRPAHIACTLPQALEGLDIGDVILLDDGKIETRVVEIVDEGIVVEVTVAKHGGSRLREEKGINFPGHHLGVKGLTPKDIDDLAFVAEHADGVNVSFVNDPDDVEDLCDELDHVEAQDLGLILKIETRFGFENLPGILLAAMERPKIGVMIARGDLAAEVGWQHLGRVQEEILWLCAAAHVPVVWATQVLENLAKKGVPSRSEISDVVMAQRAECVMLNKGAHMTRTVKTLDRILRDLQKVQDKRVPLLPSGLFDEPDPEEVGRAVGTRPTRYADGDAKGGPGTGRESESRPGGSVSR